jgi:hypothetical protein
LHDGRGRGALLFYLVRLQCCFDHSENELGKSAFIKRIYCVAMRAANPPCISGVFRQVFPIWENEQPINTTLSVFVVVVIILIGSPRNQKVVENYWNVVMCGRVGELDV